MDEKPQNRGVASYDLLKSPPPQKKHIRRPSQVSFLKQKKQEHQKGKVPSKRPSTPPAPRSVVNVTPVLAAPSPVVRPWASGLQRGTKSKAQEEDIVILEQCFLLPVAYM